MTLLPGGGLRRPRGREGEAVEVAPGEYVALPAEKVLTSDALNVQPSPASQQNPHTCQYIIAASDLPSDPFWPNQVYFGVALRLLD